MASFLLTTFDQYGRPVPEAQKAPGIYSRRPSCVKKTPGAEGAHVFLDHGLFMA
jgi:hypothetical protein